MELTFLTYNIHRAIGLDRKYRLDRVVEICRESGADVIALQEVDHLAPRSKHEDLAKLISSELNMDYQLGLNVRLKAGHYGNATFSRYPIIDSENLNITWGIKKKRGCLITRIQVQKRDIAVFNFHMGLAGMEQIRQKKRILGSDQMERLGHLPVVMLGDTNDRRSRISAAFLESGFQDSFSGKKRNATFPAYAPLLRLDRIYFSKHWEMKEHGVIRTKLTRVASDHLPVIASLELGETDD